MLCDNISKVISDSATLDIIFSVPLTIMIMESLQHLELAQSIEKIKNVSL
jgi:hypothetical protein